MSNGWSNRCEHALLPVLPALAAILITAIGAGCTAAPTATADQIMPNQTQSLVGNWQKVSHSPCSESYPDTIQFRKEGVYIGQKHEPGTFTQWDAGSFSFAGPGQVKISVANDAIILYQFSVEGDIVTFVDPDDCEFSYRKGP